MDSDPLDLAATQDLLEALQEAGCLTDAQAAAALRGVRADLRWGLWADRLLLLLGPCLVLAGVIFFFAYNWADMGRLLRFGAVEAGLAAAVAVAARADLRGLVAKVALLAACVLVGVFLAVFGQVYQTGADAWTLFAAWAALVLPWVALAQFGALCIGWVALVDAAFVLYAEQSLHGWIDFGGICLVLAAVHAAALVAREAALAAAVDWGRERWLRWVLLAAALACLTIPACALVVEPRHAEVSWILAVPLLLGGLAAIHQRFRFRTPDLPGLALGALSACVFVLFGVGRLLLAGSGGDFGRLLLFGLVALSVFAGAVHALRCMSAGFAPEDT